MPFKKWEPQGDWAEVDGQNHLVDNSPLPVGKWIRSGVIIEEPDGRVWLIKPSGGFERGHYTFPKGGIESDLSPQANAIKEAYEESGQVLGCPLFTLGSEICTQDERIRSLVQEILSNVARYFEDAIRDAQASGEVGGRNAALKARLLWGFYEGTLTRARIENNPELIRNLGADALELIGARPTLAVVA